MGSSDLHQHAFEHSVRANRLRLDPLWSRPCLAYNIHAHPDETCRGRLVSTQDRLARLDEEGLLRCPPESLHVSLGSFLFVREDYAEKKEVLWTRHASEWLQGLARIVTRVQPFTLTYRRVVVTEAAVIALADRPKEVEVIRQALNTLRSASGLGGSQPTIVHTTLFRFGAALKNSSVLLKASQSSLLDASFEVRAIVVTREVLYPSLLTHVVARFPLNAAST
jgi:hypothetical protein